MNQPQYFLVRLIGTRPGWPENMNSTEERIMGEHFNYLKDLTARKKVVIAGPVFNPTFGLIILRVDSENEARQIMAEEPSVVQKIHTYEMQLMNVALLMDYVSRDRYPASDYDKHLVKSVNVKASIEKVWQAWTTSAGIKSLLEAESKIELRIGGPYEIYFSMEPPYGQRGSEGCKVLSFLPDQMLSFEWNAPPQFGKLRQQHTQVIITIDQLPAGEVAVMLTQLGWGAGDDWDKLYAYFDSAWGNVLTALKQSLEK